jgi:ATP-binding cassette, subfamily C, bacterial
MPASASDPSPATRDNFSVAGEETAIPRTRLFRSVLTYASSLITVSRWELLTTVVLMTLTSLTEGLGVALLFPILQVAGFNMANQGHVGHYTGEVQAFLEHSGLRPSLWLATMLMVFMLLMALRSLFSRAQTVGTLKTVLKYEIALSQQLYEAIINADWPFLVRRRSSDFMHVLTAELARVATATYQFVGFLSSSTLILVYCALAFKLSAGTTLMVLVAGTALLLVSRGWMRTIHESGMALSESMRAIYSVVTEHLQSLKAIKMYDAQTADLEMFGSLENAALEENLRVAKNQAAASFWFESGSLLVLGAVIFVSLRILRVGPASILLLLAVFTRLMPRLASGGSQLQSFLSDLPAFENVTRVTGECREHAESSSGSSTPPALTRDLRLDSVCFAYEAQRPLVLDQVSITIKAGQITAVAGPSGAGKSTIADLVNGLLTPDEGSVLIDDVVLAPENERAWRRQVGYVAQDTVLFHGTVRANLLWAQPAASGSDLEEALHMAAAEFAFDLPRGLDTTVGDRGVLLSNGQRQRIALARALLRKPSLLILDEATNSLDLENEQRILDAIEQLKQHTTILMIAHRASAIRRADMIYVIEQGRVVESGDWCTLSSQSSSRAGLLFRLQGVSV